MLIRRFFHPRLAQSSYLVACTGSRVAVIVDPSRDVDLFLEAARAEGVQIVGVTETHVHADFLSGSRELAARTDAQLYLSGAGRGPWSYTDDFVEATGAVLLQDQAVIQLGAVRLEAIHTPGHTPEHLTFLVTDTAAASEPMGAITGDFLFVGDVGRPDLLERSVRVAGSADTAARTLYRSLARLRSYPDYLQVWPGHSAGSACGKGLSAVPQSTLGYERRHNWALQVGDEEQFVRMVLGGQPEPPAYFSDMKRLNAQGSVACDEKPRPAHVSPDEIGQAIDRGAVVIDARSTEAYAAGHIPGTIHIPPDRSFLTWAGSVVPLSAEVLMIGDADQVAHAVTDLTLIGIDHVVGYAGPDVVSAWQRSGRCLERVRTVSVEDAASQAQTGHVAVLDVRTAAERVQEHIAGSIHVPLPELCRRLDELDRERPMIVHCQAGSRSAIATSVLLARRFSRVADMCGGLNAWRAAGHHVLTGSAP